MRKILVALLILSVMGGAFAQESNWSVSGEAEIGTIMNFSGVQFARCTCVFTLDDYELALEILGADPVNYADLIMAMQMAEFCKRDPTCMENFVAIGGHAYNQYGWYGDIRGTLSLNYNRDGFSGGIAIQPGFYAADDNDMIFLSMSYTGDNFGFTSEHSLIKLFNNTFEPGRLWGWYRMFDMLYIEAAFVSGNKNFWNSGDIIGEVFDSDFGAFINTVNWAGYNSAEFGWGFTSVDGHNYFLLDVNLASFDIPVNFGVMLPRVFAAAGADGGKWGGGDPITYDWDTGLSTPLVGYHPSLSSSSWGARQNSLRRNVLEEVKFGVTANFSPLEVSFQYDLAQNGIYLAGKYSMGDLNFGVHMEGFLPDFTKGNRFYRLNPLYDHFDVERWIDGSWDKDLGWVPRTNNDDEFIRRRFAGYAGFAVGYNAGPLKASLKVAGAYMEKFGELGQFGIHPSVAYTLIPNYLEVSLDAFMFFDNHAPAYGHDDFKWTLAPQLWYNFKGTGAGADYWWPNNTAMIVRYIVSGNAGGSAGITRNNLDITFKWNF
jgi:hypothetical protein